MIVHRYGGQIVAINPHHYGIREPIDLRCPGCRADVRVLLDYDDKTVFLIAEHQYDCTAQGQPQADPDGEVVIAHRSASWPPEAELVAEILLRQRGAEGQL